MTFVKENDVEFNQASLQQELLIAKMGDRAHNLGRSRQMPTNNRLTSLRATSTRLIPWAIFDHEGDRRPLYNVLARLLYVTRYEYEAFATEHPELIEGEDRQYIDNLKNWEKYVGVWEIPRAAVTTIHRYRDRRAA